MPLATWNGPYPTVLLNGQSLEPGDGPVEITDEDAQSAHWTVVPDPAKATKTAKTATDEVAE